MRCLLRFGIVTILGLSLLSGCSKPETPNTGAQSQNQVDTATTPMGQAASDFLDAVLKGDTKRASARLTPAAMQRIIASGKQFDPPGLEKATFKIADIASPSDSQAIVQCVLTDNSDGTPHSEEMCCLMRKVENDWRVSGIAYGTAPDKPWTLTDFESGQNMAIPRPGQSYGPPMQANANPQQGPQGQQQGMQPGAQAGMQPQQQPVVQPNPTTMQAGPSNVNSPAPGTAGLGMPAVAPAAGGQQAPYAPSYTASGAQPDGRR